MSISVREASLSDVDIIVEYNRRLAQETEGKSLDLDVLTAGVSRGFADEGRIRYWLAESEDGRVVGQVGATREWSDWRNGWIWWLQSVYVHADVRAQGVFRALFEHVKQQAQNTPEVIGIRLYMEVNNHKARRTYESLGFHLGEYEVGEILWFNQPPR